MNLNALQRFIEQVYGLYLEHSVEDFLVTDPEVARELDSSANPREIKEKLLVDQSGDEVALALYLDPSVVASMATGILEGKLEEDTLPDFLLALEGVSHFVCLAWNAARERGVSLLELEMQAEIDKFVVVSLLFQQPGDALHLRDLRQWLFEEPQYHHALDADERHRYAQANHFAGKYCLQLEQRHWRRSGRPLGHGLFGELRRFYRLSQSDKISHIHRQYAPAV